MARRSRLLRGAVWTASCGLAATAVIGALHLPAARPLLARLGVACPVDTVTARQVQDARAGALAALRGPAPAPRRPALGLELDATTEPQAVAWTTARGLHCTASTRGLRFLRCAGVPEGALGRPGAGVVADLTLTFGPAGRLLGVDALRTRLDAGAAGTLHDRLSADLQGALGAAPESAPGFVRYRYSDYLASVTTLKLPSGPAVREQYLSLRRSPETAG